MSNIQWKTLTIGHLTRNKYWGECDYAQYHDCVATTTLIQAGGVNILVDPTFPVDQMEALLKKHSGLTREDINIIYATHFHMDHRFDADCYPNAKCYMSAASLQDAEKAGNLPEPDDPLHLFQPAPNPLVPGIRLYPLPGHTYGLTGLVFEAAEGTVLVGGDTIMGEEYFSAADGYWYNDDLPLTHQTLLEVAQDKLDVIIPGHGDWFLMNGRAPDALAEGVCHWQNLNLGCESEEAVVMVRHGEDTLVINPSLPGHLLRNAIYDRNGLEPSAVTHVLCMDGQPGHRRDVETMSNAVYTMPSDVLEQQRASAQGDDMRHVEKFTAYEEAALPWLQLVKDQSGWLCLFEAAEGTVAVCCGQPKEERLRELGVRVAILPRQKRWVIN